MIEFIKEVIGLYIERGPWFLELLAAHIRLSLMAITIAGILGLLIGILLSEHRRAAPAVIGICNVFYTIPSISMLGILIPLLGIGDQNAVTAISIYALMPMVRNTYTGLTTVDKDILEASRAMGSTRMQTLTRVTLSRSCDFNRASQYDGNGNFHVRTGILYRRQRLGKGYLPGNQYLQSGHDLCRKYFNRFTGPDGRLAAGDCRKII